MEAQSTSLVSKHLTSLRKSHKWLFIAFHNVPSLWPLGEFLTDFFLAFFADKCTSALVCVYMCECVWVCVASVWFGFSSSPKKVKFMPAYVYKLPTFPYNIHPGKVLQLAAIAAWEGACVCSSTGYRLLPAALTQHLLATESNAKCKLYAKQHPRGWLKNNKFDLEK